MNKTEEIKKTAKIFELIEKDFKIEKYSIQSDYWTNISFSTNLKE